MQSISSFQNTVFFYLEPLVLLICDILILKMIVYHLFFPQFVVYIFTLLTVSLSHLINKFYFKLFSHFIIFLIPRRTSKLIDFSA